MPLGEIGAIFCYLLATNFAESLLALSGVIVISLVLPQRWFRDLFVSRGSVLAASVLVSIMIFEYHFDKPEDYFSNLPLYLLLTFLVAGILAFLAGWHHVVRKAVEVFSENAVIFLFISLPVSLLSLIVVIIRNL
ncbi:MAG: hypothetical protein WCA79_10605 [Anaerolineales bacterium]